jgi:hypothetical protein
MTTTTFQISTSYDTGRSDYVWTYTVTARTSKFITIVDEYGEIARVGVRISRDTEYALPMGSFSQAPVISADRAVVPA